MMQSRDGDGDGKGDVVGRADGVLDSSDGPESSFGKEEEVSATSRSFNPPMVHELAVAVGGTHVAVARGDGGLACLNIRALWGKHKQKAKKSTQPGSSPSPSPSPPPSHRSSSYSYPPHHHGRATATIDWVGDDGTRLVTGSADGSVKLWQYIDHHRPHDNQSHAPGRWEAVATWRDTLFLHPGGHPPGRGMRRRGGDGDGK